MKEPRIRLRFLGAADTVTGSKTLLEAAGRRVLVDCGMFQGLKRNRLRNWRPLPVEPASLDAVILTHAHLDHSGLVPALVRAGFRGRVHATPATISLCEVLFPDSGRIHEEDAAYANRKGFTRHRPALPLFTEEDALRALGHLEPLPPGEPLAFGDLELRLQLAGHILGAASVRASVPGASVLFSGDLGRADDLVLPPPEPPGAVDCIVVESTYGDRLHADADPVARIAAIANECFARGGTLLVPAFAVGRTQAILYALHLGFERELLPRVPVFVDSPMATSATEIFRSHLAYHSLEPALCEEVYGRVHYVRSADESRELTASSEGRRIILSASGMATGGRVIHHLKKMAPAPRNTILLAGFQAPGTRGDALARGAASVKIHGEHVPVRAQVESLDLFSAHADQSGLLAWLAACPSPPRQVIVNHGEPAAADTLRFEIGERLGWRASVPEHGGVVEVG